MAYPMYNKQAYITWKLSLIWWYQIKASSSTRKLSMYKILDCLNFVLNCLFPIFMFKKKNICHKTLLRPLTISFALNVMWYYLPFWVVAFYRKSYSSAEYHWAGAGHLFHAWTPDRCLPQLHWCLHCCPLWLFQTWNWIIFHWKIINFMTSLTDFFRW